MYTTGTTGKEGNPGIGAKFFNALKPARISLRFIGCSYRKEDGMNLKKYNLKNDGWILV
jgi:hypothetical protein